MSSMLRSGKEAFRDGFCQLFDMRTRRSIRRNKGLRETRWNNLFNTFCIKNNKRRSAWRRGGGKATSERARSRAARDGQVRVSTQPVVDGSADVYRQRGQRLAYACKLKDASLQVP